MDNKVLKGLACTAIGAICWAFSGTCAQLLMNIYGVPLAWNVCVRLVFASLIYLVACLARPASRAGLVELVRTPRELAKVAGFSMLGVLMVQVCYQACISYTNAGTATVFERCGLVIIMVCLCLQAKRLPKPREYAGVALAIAGTICIATKGNLGMLAIPAEGLFWGFGSACALVFYTLMPVGLLKRWGSLVVTTAAMVISAIVANVAVQPWNIAVAVTPEVVAAMCSMVIIGTFFAYLMFLQGVQLAGPMKAGLVASIEPVAATIISAVWLGTVVTPFDALGCAMIVVMVLLVTQRES